MLERDYYLAFSLVSGIGPKTFALLLKYFKTAEKAWQSSSKELVKAGLNESLIKKLGQVKGDFNYQDYKEKLKLKKASFLAFCDKDYPKLLKYIENPPIVLYVKGNLFSIDLTKTIGIVGTRKITNYGKTVTEMISSDLALNGFTVVSGLAMGVDAVSAESAMAMGGKTIAVLGNGVDLCFPSSNEKLYDKILDGNGILVSEFPLGQTPTPGSFPSRNRIIAGLSLGVLVTEGALDSGSLITADYAFKFNRKVFAVPGPITSALSVAPLKLIEKGARLVTSAGDISRELNISVHKVAISNQKSKHMNLSKDEIKVIKVLENENLGFDEISRKIKIDSSKLGSMLSMMELKGVIKNTQGMYTVVN